MKSWDFVGLGTPAWVDLPAFGEIQAGPCFGSLASALAGRLEEYHSIPKTELYWLVDRVGALLSLENWLLQQEFEPALLDWLHWLAKLARDKARYLECLWRIFAEGWDQEEQLKAYLEDPPYPLEKPFRLLRLTQDRFLFPDRSVFWGNYAMECLDPCHRQLPQFYKVWEQLPRPKPPYLLWLETFSTYRHEQWVRYLTAEGASEKLCCFAEGRLLQRRGRPLSCAERQHFLFVIDCEKRLLVARADPQLCHASFTRGKPVLASGVLQAREGQLTHLKFESGHYLSGPEDWWQAIELFQEMGWEASRNRLRITVFDRMRYLSRQLEPEAFRGPQSFLRALGLGVKSFLTEA